MIGRSAWLVLVAVTACGRVGFDPLTDAPASQGIANVAFVTSTISSGNLGGLAGADAICAQRATEAGLAGTFVAWLAASNTSMFSRLAGSRGWRRVDGTPLADDASDLFTGSLLAPLALDEQGRDVRASATHTWTGTLADGTSSGATCADWTSADPASPGMTGRPAEGGDGFSSASVEPCDIPHALNCFEVGRVSHVVVEHTVGRYAFVTSSTWLPSANGIAAADALCSGEATRAHLPGSYRALLATAGRPAASRFDLTRARWVRVDGMQLAASAAALFSRPVLDDFLDQRADGSVVMGAGTWIGDPNGGTCADWTTPIGPATALVGDPLSTDAGFFGIVSVGCNDFRRNLVCLQE